MKTAIYKANAKNTKRCKWKKIIKTRKKQDEKKSPTQKRTKSNKNNKITIKNDKYTYFDTS